MNLYSIGTSHTYQKGMLCAPAGCYDEFKSLVRDVAQRYGVKTIAEELSAECLGAIAASLCAEVANDLSIYHLFCDPNKAERQAAGLPLEDCPATWGPRECEWLRRLGGCEFPVMFVCGANHVDSFSAKCGDKGIAVEVLARDWQPSQRIAIEHLIL